MLIYHIVRPLFIASSTYVSLYHSLAHPQFAFGTASNRLCTINYWTFPALWIGTGKYVLIKRDKCTSKQNSEIHQSELLDDELR